MAGILDYKQWLQLYATEEDIKQTFPRDQYILDLTINSNGADSYNCDINWVTLIFDKIEYDRNDQPVFNDTKILGYFDGSSQNLGVTTELILPANMYAGPTLPDAPRNIPVTFVNINWSKTGKSFQRTLALIQNWEPGTTIGDPTLDDNYNPIAGTTSTLYIGLSSGPVIFGETFVVTAESNIPVDVLALGNVTFYAQSTSTTLILGTSTFTNNIATLSVETDPSGNINDVPANVYTIYALWPGRREYIRTFSDTATQIVFPGISIDVLVDVVPQPIVIPNGVNASSTGTFNISATTSSAFLPTGDPIENVYSLIIPANARTNHNTDYVSSTATFVNGSGTQSVIFNDNEYSEKTLDESSVFTIITATVNSTQSVVTALVTSTYTATVVWEFDRPHKYVGGTTSTTFNIENQRDYTFDRRPIVVQALEQFGQGSTVTSTSSVSLTYNTLAPTIQFRARAQNSHPISTGSVVFKALYTTTFETTSFEPEVISTTTTQLKMPRGMNRFAVNLNSISGIQVGATYSLPGLTNTSTVRKVYYTTGTNYSDNGIAATSDMVWSNDTYAPNAHIGENVTFNNPDGSTIIARLSGQFQQPNLKQLKDGVYDLGVLPDRMVLTNSSNVVPGSEFRFTELTPRPIRFSETTQGMNTSTIFRVTRVDGDTIFTDPPWGIYCLEPNNTHNMDIISTPPQYWDLCGSLRQVNVDIKNYQNRNFVISSLVQPINSYQSIVYPSRLYLNNVSGIEIGAQFSVHYSTGTQRQISVGDVNYDENWIECDDFSLSEANLKLGTHEIVFVNPTDSISLPNPRKTTDGVYRLESATGPDKFTFNNLPPLSPRDDTFTLGNRTWPIYSVNTATDTIRTSTWTGNFNPTPWINARARFTMNTANQWNFLYVSNSVGQPLGADGLRWGDLEDWNTIRSPNEYKFWLKFEDLPSDLMIGDYLVFDTVNNPGLDRFQQTSIGRITISDIDYYYGIVEVRGLLSKSSLGSDIFTPGPHPAYYWSVPYPLAGYNSSNNCKFIPGPAKFYHYNNFDTETYSPLNNYQTVTLGTVTTSTWANNQVEFKLDSANLNRGTYYYWAEPAGSIDDYDVFNKPTTSTSKTKLIVSRTSSTSFYSELTVGANDVITIENGAVENFYIPVSVYENATFLGTATSWTRVDDVQISTLTLPAHTISNPSNVILQWPGTAGQLRANISDYKFSSSTFRLTL